MLGFSQKDQRLIFRPFSDQANKKEVVESHHCACCPFYKPGSLSLSPRTCSTSVPHKSSGVGDRVIQVVEFNDDNDGYKLVEQPQEVWPFLESGRAQKQFETLKVLGQGACGTVSQVRHKLDNRIYALKKIPLHTEFDPDCQEPILQHPAMKEI